MRAQALPLSQPLVVSGTPLIAGGERLYFGSSDRAYEYDPAALSASGRGLTREIAPATGDWLAFREANGAAILPVSGGTRDGKECFRGLRRYAPAGETLFFSTKECLFAEQFPAVLLGAANFQLLGERLFYTRQGVLYMSDGTIAGSKRLANLGSEHSQILRLGDRLLWAGGGSFSYAYEMLPASTAPRLMGSVGALITGPLVPIGPILYAVGSTTAYGKELHRFDLGANRTLPVSDVKVGPESSNPGELTVLHDAVYMHASGPSGDELYRANSAGLTLVRDLHPTGSATPRELTVLGDLLYFRADDGVSGEELWVTDGTEAGTRLVRDLSPGRRGSRPNGLTGLGGALYFWADDGVWGESLWRVRAGTLELVETTTFGAEPYIDGALHDWPAQYAARAIRDVAGDVGPGDPIDFRSARLGWKGRSLFVGYELDAPVARADVARMHMFFDVDHRPDTGLSVQSGLKTPFGADYMIEGITLYRYKPGSGNWDWETLGHARWSDRPAASTIELLFDAAPIHTTGIVGARVLLWGSNTTQDDYAAFEAQ